MTDLMIEELPHLYTSSFWPFLALGVDSGIRQRLV